MSISPNEVEARLRQIADRIESDKFPSRTSVAAQLHTLAGELDIKDRHELEKKTKDVLKKTQDELSKKMEGLVDKGIPGEGMADALKEMGKGLDEMERKSR